MNVFNTANISRIIIYTKIIDIPLNPVFLLFVKVLKALSRENGSRCPEELFNANNLALVSGTHET